MNERVTDTLTEQMRASVKEIAASSIELRELRIALLVARNVELERELAEARATGSAWKLKHDAAEVRAVMWETGANELQDRLAEARAKLREAMKYARHTIGCRKNYRTDKSEPDCDCGLDALRIEGESHEQN